MRSDRYHGQIIIALTYALTEVYFISIFMKLIVYNDGVISTVFHYIIAHLPPEL